MNAILRATKHFVCVGAFQFEEFQRTAVALDALRLAGGHHRFCGVKTVSFEKFVNELAGPADEQCLVMVRFLRRPRLVFFIKKHVTPLAVCARYGRSELPVNDYTTKIKNYNARLIGL